MKKIFTLTLVFLAMMFGVNAQYLLQEGFETGTLPTGWVTVDADADGYCWEGSANPASYFQAGTDLSGNGHNSSNGFVLSGSYSNVYGVLTPDNWLITPAINLTANADLTFWVCAQDASYAAEHYGVYISTTAGTTPADFTLIYEETIDANGGSRVQGTWKQKTVNLANYTGQTVRIAFRHFNCSDEFVFNLDDVEIFAQPTSPTIAANPSTINFGTALLGNTANATVNVTAYNLTSAITATTTAPFSVSADGTTYGTTASIAAAGGTLYVQYTPTAAGTDNGTVNLSSTGATDVTITLTGNALDCSNITVPFTEGFEGSIECWTMVSMDPANDDRFGVYADANAYAGSYDFRFSSFSSATDYNQYLITPQLTLDANETYFVKFYYKGYNSSENFKVMYSTTNSNISSFTELSDYTNVATSWTEVILQLPAGTKYVAIDYYGNYQYYLYVDNFSILTSAPSMTLSTNALDFGTLPAGATSANQAVVMSTINVNEAFTLTTAAPFEVSLDGVSFAATQTIPTNATTMVNETFYVRFAPTTVGTFNQNLTITSTNFNETITLAGEAIDCSNTTIPYTTNFNNEGTNQCWEIVDANNDGKTFNFNTSDGYAYYQYSSTNVADDWLISPVFTLTGAEFCYFDYAAQSTTYPERFQVFAIDANNNNIALSGAIDVTSTDFQTQIADLTSLTGNYRIGIHCISDEDKYYLKITNFNINNNIPAASVALSTDALDFSTIALGSVPVKTVVLNTINVNEAFTVTTTAPYEVSLDGVTFAATQTIPANAAIVVDDTIYVRFAPTTVGTFNQTLTVTSATTNNTVTLTGAAVDCSTGIASLPYTYGFEDQIAPPMCWTALNPENYSPGTISEGNGACVFLDADVLITPEIHSNDAMLMQLDYVAYFGSEADDFATFRIGYSSTDNNVSSFTWQNAITANQDNIETLTTTIPAGTKYIAIEVTNIGSGLYGGLFEYPDYLFIDNFSLISLSEPLILVSPESLSFGSVMVGATSAAKQVSVSGILLTNDIAVSAPANFEVSTNGSSYAGTATIPSNGGTLYVRYNPSAAGNHSGNITLTSGTTNKTIAVSGSAVDCSAPINLPFFEGFESELTECWVNLDEDGDGYSWMNAGMTPYEGDGCYSSASYINDAGALNPDNWLITPALAIPSQGAILSFYVVAQDASWAGEHYGVYVSTNGVNPSNFTLLYEEDLDADGGPRVQGTWKQKTVNLPYGNQNINIAIRHFNCSDMFWMNIDNFQVTPGTGIENHEAYTKVYPNPAKNVVNIDANCNINRVEVYNMMGQMVGMYDVNDMNTQINTTNFANGVYTVKIATENGMSTKKFTVAR